MGFFRMDRSKLLFFCCYVLLIFKSGDGIKAFVIEELAFFSPQRRSISFQNDLRNADRSTHVYEFYVIHIEPAAASHMLAHLNKC